MPDDALTIATVETGVALRAFDAEQLEGRLCIRDSAPGRVAGRPAGRADAGDAVDRRRARPLELLFGGDRRGPRRRPRTLADRCRGGPGQGRAPDRGRRGALDRLRARSRPPDPLDFLNGVIAHHGAPMVIYTRTRVMPDLLDRDTLDWRFESEATSASRAPSCAARSAASSSELLRLSRRGLPARSRSTPASPLRSREPRVAGLGELERSATRSRRGSPRLAAPCARAAPTLETRNRELLERMLAAPAELQVGADLPRRPRRARLRPLALAPPPRPARDADGLVAGQDLLRMPVIRAACGR